MQTGLSGVDARKCLLVCLFILGDSVTISFTLRSGQE
jgi:hypothetical protein